VERAASIGRRVEAARRRCRLSQAELGERTGLHQSAVAYFEAGRRVPSTPNLVRLAQALDVSTDYLLGLPVRGRFEHEDMLTHADRKHIQALVTRFAVSVEGS